MENSRFKAIESLYGQQAFEKIQRAHVAVIGLGGVGSWVVESLARSGVGYLTLIDQDEICISNTNRQIHALDGSFGLLKTVALENRIKKINPNCIVHIYNEFFTEKSLNKIFKNSFDLVIDGIDSLQNKCLLLSFCYHQKIPIITCGGSAGKTDPTMIKVCDLNLSKDDPLLYRVRKKLKKDHNLSRQKKLLFNIDCVYSNEPTKKFNEDVSCQITTQDSDEDLINILLSNNNCEQKYGSVTHLTGTFGFFMSSLAIKKIVQSQIP